ncbi:hypothetical protein GCM10023092_09600 [Rurimicrobium arvi]|uniref:Phage tail collar domain-containing protein n=2 Tax=Rurimicrobium arvi TaxID=2049916 RepID=A0ABP8MM86_9BACT
MLQSPVKDSIAKLIGSSPVKDSLNVNYWNLKGNANTNSGSNFIGTTDNISLRVRSNNTERMVVDSTGKVGIGLSAPTNTLHVKATSNPLKLEGLQSGSFTTDSVLTADANGVVRRVAMSTAPDQTVGSIEAFAFSAIPSDYLECNGNAVSRTTFATLFAKIGTTYGAGDGSTTFNLPDLRGEFIRGWDHGRGVELGSRPLGSWQKGSAATYADMGGTGSHFLVRPPSGGTPAWNDLSGIDADNYCPGPYTNYSATVLASFTGSSGTGWIPTARPRNVAMVYAIKAKESVMLPTGQSVTSLITANEPWEKKGTGVGSTSFTDTITHSGPIQIKDGSEGAGKVLTSDANGVATWKSAGLTATSGTVTSVGRTLAFGVHTFTGFSVTVPVGKSQIFFGAHTTGSASGYATYSLCLSSTAWSSLTGTSTPACFPQLGGWGVLASVSTVGQVTWIISNTTSAPVTIFVWGAGSAGTVSILNGALENFITVASL